MKVIGGGSHLGETRRQTKTAQYGGVHVCGGAHSAGCSVTSRLAGPFGPEPVGLCAST